MKIKLHSLLLISAITLGAVRGFADTVPLKSLNGTLTASGDSGDFVFVVAGDNRSTAKGAPLPRVLTTIFSEIRLIRPDLVLWTGDTVYGYGDKPAELEAEYAAYTALAARADVPLFNAPGNHEMHSSKPCTDLDSENQFKKHFGGPYGSFNYRGAHFIALDTEECGHTITTAHGEQQVVDGAQLEWLKQDLEANKSARAIFVFFHTEITEAENDEEKESHHALGNAAELRTLFEQYPVKAVFQGHEHLFYQKEINGIRYFVAGGAGAPLYAPTENGGFSHYLTVEMKNDKLTYKIVEPGHLYTQDGKAASAAERMVWLINSSDMDLPARRIEFSVPKSLGTCANLTAESRLVKWNGTKVAVPVKIAKCATSGDKRNLTILATDFAPKRNSVPIYVMKK